MNLSFMYYLQTKHDCRFVSERFILASLVLKFSVSVVYTIHASSRYSYCSPGSYEPGIAQAVLFCACF